MRNTEGKGASTWLNCYKLDVEDLKWSLSLMYWHFGTNQQWDMGALSGSWKMIKVTIMATFKTKGGCNVLASFVM